MLVLTLVNLCVHLSVTQGAPETTPSTAHSQLKSTLDILPLLAYFIAPWMWFGFAICIRRGSGITWGTDGAPTVNTTHHNPPPTALAFKCCQYVAYCVAVALPCRVMDWEVYLLLDSVWRGYLYNVSGALFLVGGSTVLIIAAASLLCTCAS